MKITRKQLAYAASIVFGVWLLTLGLFHERDIDSSFHVASGDAWAAFENGSEIFYPNSLIEAGHRRTIGVPYLVHSVSDCPPYGLSFCFTAHVEQQVKSITIETIHIKYDESNVATAIENPIAQTSPFILDDRGADRGDTPYLRADVSFSDCLHRRESFWATIKGNYVIGDEVSPYETRVRVNIHGKSYWYPGWIALLLRQL